MIQTIQLTEQLGTAVLNLVKSGGQPFFTGVRTLGRKLKDGQIQIIGTETYAGPDGGAAPYLYFRYRDNAKEHTFTRTKGLDSSPHVEVRAMLRAVAVHKCRNEGELQTALVAALMYAPIRIGGMPFDIVLQAASARGQTIIAEETVEEANHLGEAELIAVDFDMVYKLSADEYACSFTCDACC